MMFPLQGAIARPYRSFLQGALFGAASLTTVPATVSAAYVTVYGADGAIPTFPGQPIPLDQRHGTAVNDAGTAVGYVQATGFRAVRWNASGSVNLPDSGVSAQGTTFSRAYAINEANAATGNATKYDELGIAVSSHAVRWDAAGVPQLLDRVGTSSNVGLMINDAGTVAGTIAVRVDAANTTNTRAVRWNAGGTAAEVLGNLGTDENGSTSTTPHAINASGTIVGSAGIYDASGNFRGARAVRWDATGTAATPLQHLGDPEPIGQLNSAALAINDGGTIVGYSEILNASGNPLGPRAVRWAAGGTQVTELGNL